MTPLLDTSLGGRAYLNAGQLLHALPRPGGVTRVRVRFRRLTTRPGRWARDAQPGQQETAQATLYLGDRTETLRFMTDPGLRLKTGAVEPVCEIRDLNVMGDHHDPSSAELSFEGPVWPAMIEACKLIMSDRPGASTRFPVSVDGGAFLLDPAPVNGRLRLERLQDRMGVRLLRVTVTGGGVMVVGLTGLKTV